MDERETQQAAAGTPSRPQIRLLNDGPLSGVENMARDEALLMLVGRGASPPTFRLYEWSEPTISLGYFQRHDDRASLAEPVRSMPVVRRLTGGGAILHDRELTYSLTVPQAGGAAVAADAPYVVRGGANAVYERVHDALIQCLNERDVTARRGGPDDGSGAAKGPFFCFARRHRFDVLLGPDKIVGSAQRRTREAILQHGSILLGQRFDAQPSGALERLGIDGPYLRRHLPNALAHQLGADVVEAAWTDEELALADALAGKYADPVWTRKR